MNFAVRHNTKSIATLVVLILGIIGLSIFSVWLYVSQITAPAPTDRSPTVQRYQDSRAQCRDGYYTFSMGSGSCSGHGGIRERYY